MEKKIKQVKSKINIPDKPPVELISYTIRATIPTMMYGNIQPEITVKAGTIAEASYFALDHINWLFKMYMEDPRDGKMPKFMRNIEVKETEKTTPPTSTPTTASQNVPTPPVVTASTPSIPFTKALNMINNARTIEAVDLISSQVEKSTKLTNREKLDLSTPLIAKRNELNGSAE